MTVENQSFSLGTEGVVYRFPLDVARGVNTRDAVLSQLQGYLHFAFYDANMQPVPTAYVEIILGQQDIESRVHPMHHNGSIQTMSSYDKVRLSWPSQPGVTLYLTTSSDPSTFDKNTPIPIVSVNINSASNGAPVRGNVTNAAAQFVAARPGRRQLSIKNRDTANAIYIGFANTVTAANGYELTAGETLTLLEFDGAIFAIASVASVPAQAIEVY